MMFWIGLIVGSLGHYIVREVLDARKVNDTNARLYRCAIEVAKLDTERNLSRYTDTELVGAIAKGLEPLARGSEPAWSLYSPVRGGKKGPQSNG